MVYSYYISEDDKLHLFINGKLHAVISNVTEADSDMIIDELLDDYIEEHKIFSDFDVED